MSKRQARVEDLPADVDNSMSAADISKLLVRAREEVGLSVVQEYVIRQLSDKLEGKTKKQLSVEMGRSEWQIYNIRRDAVRKLAKLLGVLDEEELFPLLSIKRGHRMPERHTQYWREDLQAPEVQAMATYIEEGAFDPDEENIDDGGKAAAEEFTQFGDPDEEPFEDEESEDDDDDDDEVDEDDEPED